MSTSARVPKSRLPIADLTARAAPGSPITVELVDEVVSAAARRTDDAVRQSALQVIPAFNTPKFIFDPTRRTYDLCVNSRLLFDVAHS